MAYQVGPLSLAANTDTTADLSWVQASGGTGPYHYEIHRSTVSGFTPGAGNLIATTANTGIGTFHDSGLIPNTQYFYVVRAVDEGNGNATTDTNQLAVLTNFIAIDPNQFAQSTIVGLLDQHFNFNTMSVILDAAQTTPIKAGTAVKIVNPPTAENQTPHVVACTADSDPVFGFVQFSQKDRQFMAGDRMEISQGGNVQYLMPVANGNAGDQAQSSVATGGGVKSKVGASGASLVGYFVDQPVAGTPCRVHIQTPTFATA